MLRKYPLQPLRTSRMNQFQLRMSQSPLKNKNLRKSLNQRKIPTTM